MLWTGVSRVARESVRGLLPPDGLAPWRQPLVPRCAPLRAAASARPAPCGGGRPTPQPFDGGLTPCRMRFACSLRSFGSRAPSPLRAHARADGYRGLPAFAFALPGRQRSKTGFHRDMRDATHAIHRQSVRRAPHLLLPPPRPIRGGGTGTKIFPVTGFVPNRRARPTTRISRGSLCSHDSSFSLPKDSDSAVDMRWSVRRLPQRLLHGMQDDTVPFGVVEDGD